MSTKFKLKELESLASNNPRSRTPWTDEEVDVLVEYYNRVSVTKLAEYLNRSYGSVVNKWRTLQRDLVEVDEEAGDE